MYVVFIYKRYEARDMYCCYACLCVHIHHYSFTYVCTQVCIQVHACVSVRMHRYS